jgi:hypothetical protein
MIKEMTATVALGISSIGTIGYSDSAKFILNRKMDSICELKKADFYFPVMNRVMPELEEVALETSRIGWDGYNAKPVQNETVAQAYAFLEAMPNIIPPPSISAEPDGHITFEWYKSPRRTLSVSITPTGELHYAALFGPNKSYGTEIFFGEIPKNIFDLIGRVHSS